MSGNYSGSITLTYPEVPLTLTCPATTVIAQSGSSVSIAPLPALSCPCSRAASARAPVRSTPDRYVRRGLASWYGDAFDGKPTASGEPFDSNQFTTAHYDLPFDSRVRVRNLNNDREVELRVNDRVPLEALNNGRILDVSYAAARQLEMVEDGVVPIEISASPSLLGNEAALLAMSWRTIAPTSSMSMSTSGFSVKGPGLSSGSGSIEITAR